MYLVGGDSASKVVLTPEIYLNLHLTVFKEPVIFVNLRPLSHNSVPPSMLPDLG
jgi:hypothetical protein